MSSWVSLALLLALASQVLLVTLFSWQIRCRRNEYLSWGGEPTGGWPSAEVILCLRGAGESLPSMLTSLAGQRYAGKWRLQIIVDSFDDPSWKIVQEFVDTQSHILKANWQDLKLQTLAKRPIRGSLKCASLLQAFSKLNSESEVIAIIDADAVVRPDWLSNLVQACCQPGVGAVSGNRWFVPGGMKLMPWTRSVWNAGALVLMTLFSIPWGGSLAVRREVVDAASWKVLLRSGLCEDTGLLGPLNELGLRYVFRPELLIVDRDENISFVHLSKWITRQLLTARLHHPAWPVIFLHGVGTFFLLLGSILNGDWQSVVIYEIGCLGLLVWIEAIAMQRPPHSLLGWAFALLIGQFVNGFATLAALSTNKVEWSEIVYKVTLNPRGVALMTPPKSIDVESTSSFLSSSQNDQ